MSMTRGLFISFEGIDGAGKSTHIAAVADLFREGGRNVTLTREPGGTPLAEKLRQLLLHEAMDPLSEALLMFAARRDHVCQVIGPALARGDVVLSDRYTDATFAYQGHGRGFDLQVLRTLERWVQHLPTHAGLIEPDLTFWFDLPASVAAARLAQARTPDRFEAETEAFFERVSAGYAARMRDAPARFARIDGAGDLVEVRAAVIEVCRQRGWTA
jgi:dTMP kinase